MRIAFVLILFSFLFHLNTGYATGSSYGYLKTLIESHGLLNLARGPIYRRCFATSSSTPTLNAYIKQQLPNIDFDDPQLADPRSEERQSLEETKKQWVEEFFPEPTEEQVLADLEENDNLRAHMVTFLLLEKVFRNSGLVMPTEQLFAGSIGASLITMAIDGDIEVEELVERFNQVSEDGSTFSVSYADTSLAVPSDEYVKYDGLGEYLLRQNSVRHKPLSDEQTMILESRSFTSDLLSTVTQAAAGKLIRSKVQVRNADDGWIFDLPVPFAVDLMVETGIVGDFTLVPLQLAVQAVAFIVITKEMGFSVAEGKLDEVVAEIEDILYDADNPASLFQIVQLARLGFSLAEIKALTYEARDAIIVSDPEDQQSFIAQHRSIEGLVDENDELNIEVLNSMVTATGPLVFRLLNIGYDLDDINPHLPPSHEEIDQEIRELRFWLLNVGPFSSASDALARASQANSQVDEEE